MIQPLRPMSATPIRNNNNCKTNFGNDYEPRSGKAKRFAKYVGGEFVRGAIVSVVVDGLSAGLHKVFPKSSWFGTTSLKNVAANAGVWGLGWVALGLVFTGLHALGRREK